MWGAMTGGWIGDGYCKRWRAELWPFLEGGYREFDGVWAVFRGSVTRS